MDDVEQDNEPAVIKVTKASYGLNCGIKEGNVTDSLAKECNGRIKCSYKIDHRRIGDPSVRCKKTYHATYECNGQMRTVHIPAEASGKTVQLKCE